jgi:dienelactone hydrolase
MGGAATGGAESTAGRANSEGGRRGGAGGAGQAGAGRAGDGGGSGAMTSGGAGGTAGRGAGGAAGAAGASTGSGTCTASKASSTKVSGSGTHQVVVETNSDAGIREGTIFRPADLGGTEKYPIIVWGEGGCSENGLSTSGAMAELASHGYFVIADGTPNGSGSRPMDSSNPASMGKPLLAYVDWAVAENGKACSAYYQSLDTTKIGANGFSCGGLMSEGTAGDPRITTWGLNSSGLLSANQAFYKTVHTPVLVVLGGSDDVAYENGERDYTNLSGMSIPIMLFSKALGHGGDLFSKNGGDFTKIDLGWFNWWLKGDETATGKGVLVGASCKYCTDSAWEVKSANLP